MRAGRPQAKPARAAATQIAPAMAKVSVAPPRSRSMPVAASETGASATEPSISRLITRPRIASAARACSQAMTCTLMKPTMIPIGAQMASTTAPGEGDEMKLVAEDRDGLTSEQEAEVAIAERSQQGGPALRSVP